MRNLVWKIVFILVVIALCVSFIVLKGIRLGKDLRGGVSLIYAVHMPDDVVDPQGLMTQMITVLQDRVNPKGQLDISMLPLGRNRLEIAMPLSSQEVRDLKDAYLAALATLLAGAQIPAGDLEAALGLNQAVELYGGEESEKKRKVRALQDAFDTLRSARDARLAAKAQGAPQEQMNPLEQAEADARYEYERLHRQVLRLNLEEARVARAIRLSEKRLPRLDASGEQFVDPSTDEKLWFPSPRDIELDSIRAQYPHVAADLDTVIEAYDTYAKERKGFDDPEDLMRLLRGAGVLDFHIAVRSNNPQGVNPDEMRRQLAERGPDNTESPTAKWFPVNDLKQWYDKPEDLASLQADPVGYFTRRRDLVAAERDGEYYLLLYITESKSITHRPDLQWSVVGTGRTSDSLGRPAVFFRLDAVGGQQMSRLTTKNVGEPMAVVLDKQVYSAPTIIERIGATGQISGTFSQAELDYLIHVLAAGSLEATLSRDPIAINTMGPSIGADNLKAGTNAFIIAIIAVAAFMVLYYFFAGVVASIALIVNGLIIFGFMSFIDGTFTLPGLAGIVLTIGMAVDANVLIYERIREEIFGGEVELRRAIRLGYQKALSTILDANITNLIICLVLYNTATTEVKGFALTLSIGIIATLFTALFVTRVIYEVYTDVARITRLPMLPTVFPAVHRFLEPNINWIGLRKVFWSLSIVGIVCSIVLVSVRGVNMFDTEFRGGVAATMQTAVIDDDGDGQPDQTIAGKPVRHPLPHTGPDGVETRVQALVGLMDANTPGLDQDTRVRFLNALRARGSDLDEDQITAILQEFRNASVLTVGDTTVLDNVIHAESFQIKVANPKGLGEEETITDVVVAAIVTEFGTQLDVTAPLDFDGAGSANHTLYTSTVEKDALGDNIGRPQFSQRVTDFLGGVAVVIDDIDPPVSPEDVEKRIDRMRQQEDFARLLGRRVKVFGLDPADAGDPRAGYRSVVVLVHDSKLSSLKVDFDLWDRELAQTEWELISLALQRQTSLEQITTFSPAIAQSLKDKAIVAVGLSLLGILVYIWIRFGSLRYSLAAIVALVHDVTIAMGLLAATAWLGRGVLGTTLLIEEFRIDLGVVAALLTIIGYSLNDTIVILDRIRENRGKLPIPTADIVNKSINQTISRTVITSMTTLLAVGIMYGAGGSGLRPFTFCLLIGLVVGTYSSVAIAAPLVFKSESTGPSGSSAKTQATANAEPFTDEPAAATA